MTLNKHDVETLEAILDRSDITQVLDALSDICGEKSEHLTANWQDGVSADMWDRYAKAINACTATIRRL